MKIWPTVLRGVVSNVETRRRSYATHRGGLIHAVEVRLEINSAKVFWRSPQEFQATDGDDIAVAGYWRGDEVHAFAWRNLTRKTQEGVSVSIFQYLLGLFLLLVPGGLLLEQLLTGFQGFHLVGSIVLGLAGMYGGYLLLVVHGMRWAVAELRAHS